MHTVAVFCNIQMPVVRTDQHLYPLAGKQSPELVDFVDIYGIIEKELSSHPVGIIPPADMYPQADIVFRQG